jgi:hypothetical protein
MEELIAAIENGVPDESLSRLRTPEMAKKFLTNQTRVRELYVTPFRSIPRSDG